MYQLIFCKFEHSVMYLGLLLTEINHYLSDNDEAQVVGLAC